MSLHIYVVPCMRIQMYYCLSNLFSVTLGPALVGEGVRAHAHDVCLTLINRAIPRVTISDQLLHEQLR